MKRLARHGTRERAVPYAAKSDAPAADERSRQLAIDADKGPPQFPRDV